MKRLVSLLFGAALVFGLAGCPASGVGQYPMEVNDGAVSPGYPQEAVGFRRSHVLRYQPGNADVSVGYNLLTQQAQIVSTIYVSEASVFPGLLNTADPVAVLFNDHKQYILRGQANARLLGEGSATLTKHGKTYEAMRATFEFEGSFRGRQQTLFSILMVWRDGDRFIKLRSTLPAAQRNLWESNNMALLDAVDWTQKPL